MFTKSIAKLLPGREHVRRLVAKGLAALSRIAHRRDEPGLGIYTHCLRGTCVGNRSKLVVSAPKGTLGSIGQLNRRSLDELSMVK